MYAIIAPSVTAFAARRFAAVLAYYLELELALFALPPVRAPLVFTKAWHRAVAQEKPHHGEPSAFVEACMLGVWFLRHFHACGKCITFADIGQAELRHPALGLPILNDVMLDVPNPN